MEGDKLPLQRRTSLQISIHALRMEGDVKREHLTNAVTDFYPRPPDGGRLNRFAKVKETFLISIHALRMEGDLGATDQNCLKFISIHALRMEGDLHELEDLFFGLWISIHALRVEGDKRVQPMALGLGYFYPRPPGGGRPSPS